MNRAGSGKWRVGRGGRRNNARQLQQEAGMRELGSGRAASSAREARHEQLNQPPRGKGGGENIIYEMRQPLDRLQPAAPASPRRCKAAASCSSRTANQSAGSRKLGDPHLYAPGIARPARAHIAGAKRGSSRLWAFFTRFRAASCLLPASSLPVREMHRL